MITAKLTIALLLLLPASLPAQETGKGGSRTEAFQKLRQARVAALSGESEKAHQLVAEARAWADSHKDRLVAAWAAQQAGEFAFAAKQFDQAATSFTTALAAFTEVQDQPGVANCRLNLGRLAQTAGKPADAAGHQQAALVLYQKLNRPAEIATTLSDLATSHKAQGRTAEAKAALQKAHALYRDSVKQPAAEVRVLGELAACCEAAGETDAALQHLNAAVILATELKDPAEQGHLHHALGRLKHKSGALDEAARHYQTALQQLASVPGGGESAAAATRNNLGALLLDQGKAQEALAELTKALEVLTRLDDVPGQSRTLYNLALVYEGQGKEAKAIETYEKALALRRQVQDTAGVARVLDNLSLLYASQGKTDRAKAAGEEAGRLRKK